MCQGHRLSDEGYFEVSGSESIADVLNTDELVIFLKRQELAAFTSVWSQDGHLESSRLSAKGDLEQDAGNSSSFEPGHLLTQLT